MRDKKSISVTLPILISTVQLCPISPELYIQFSLTASNRKLGWGLRTRLSCVYTIPGLFRTASNGKLGGAWERDYLVYIQFQGFSVLRAMESWAGPGNETILCIYNSRAFPYCKQWKAWAGPGNKAGPGNESILCTEKITLVLRPRTSSLAVTSPSQIASFPSFHPTSCHLQDA